MIKNNNKMTSHYLERYSLTDYLRLILFSFLIVFFLVDNVFSIELDHLVSEQKLKEKIKTIEEINDPEDQSKKKLLEHYSKTLDYLDIIKASNSKTKEYKNTILISPKKIKLLQKKFANLQTPKTDKQKDKKPLSKHDITDSLEKLEQQYASESILLTSLSAKNSNLSQAISNESNSLESIRKKMAQAKSTIEKLHEDSQLIPEDISAEEKQAIQWRLDAHIASLQSQLTMWEQLLLSQPMRLQILKLEYEISEHELSIEQEKLSQLQKKIALKRTEEIKQSQKNIQEEQLKAQGKHPVIQALAKKNTLLNQSITNKINKLTSLEPYDDEIYKAISKLQQEQKNTKKKLDIAGLNQILGQVLYEQKKALPDQKRYQKQIKKRQELIAHSGLDDIRYQEELLRIKDKKSYIKQLIIKLPKEEQQKFYDDLSNLVDTRKKLLKKAIEVDEKYLKVIGDIDFAERQYLDVVRAYSEFLDEHLFWLRSAPVLNLQNLKNIPEQISFFLQPEKWLRFLNDLIVVVKTSNYIFPILLFLSVFLYKKAHLTRLLIETGLKTKRISTDSLWHTFQAFFYTMLLAIPLPILLYLLSSQLLNLPNASEFTYAIALGIKFIVPPLFWLKTFRYLCFPEGIADIHFKWSNELIMGLRKEIWRLMITFLPLLFLTALLVSKGESSVNGGLGRLSLILTLFTFAIFFYHLVKPKTGLLAEIAKNNPDSFFAKFQGLWLILGLMSITTLIVLTIVGYVYTAGQMTASLIYTVWMIFALVFLQQLSVRWLLMSRRKYALKLAYEKRKAFHEKKQLSDDDAKEDPEHAIEFDEPEIDMVSLSEESIKLLNLVLFIAALVGLGAIWSDVLPALGILDKFVLWHYNGVVDGTEKILPITLWDIIQASVMLILTLVSAKRLPAILEILLIQSSFVSSGSRYTITTLVNYLIIGLGFFSIFNILGARWAELQWLFAALSVGIGFGLQEIVANFISGIIILFERPIRVGDYVSIGDNEGVVSKIQIRATTIMTRDRKELLVPNKEFITGQLLNWSLSDPTARLIIPVGVAYGSDIPLARKLLLEAAQENERVLSEPIPRVVFYNFGDNTLDLQLRCFIGNVDFRLRTISEINEAINEKFNTADINIAFPQRDVHLDINQPIDIVLTNKSK